MDGRENWITLREVPKDRAIRLLFRRTFSLEDALENGICHISADSRYKFYVNDQLVEIGPSKGDREIWYYDTIEIAPFLRKGKNVIAVEVLSYPVEHGKGCYGIFRTGHPGMFFKGMLKSKNKEINISADKQWKVCMDFGFSIIPESDIFAPLQIMEERYADPELIDWKKVEFDDSKWEQVVLDTTLSAQCSPGNLNKRTIPFLYREDKKFIDSRVVYGKVQKEKMDELLAGKQSITIDAGQKIIVEINAGEEETGYLHLMLAGGKGSKIHILTSEGYVQEGFQGDLNNPFKKDRLDMENGYLHGFTDVYYPAGNGTKQKPEEYVPFWFRTFRFIRLEIEASREPVTLLNFYYTETGYPLEVQTKASADDPDFDKIWDISERTLRRCMHETYEDCPFYEQLQYAMDSRTQILYTYAISGDDRLARKCMDDFRRSQRYDGLINSSHPNYESNVIPGFSIYYILMLYDHMMYFGDKVFLRKHLPHMDQILSFFHEHLTEHGYVDKIGGLNGKDRFWSFIDWTMQWDKTSGVPDATLYGPITMESLLYIYGLQTASKIAAYLGMTDLASEYRDEYKKVQKAVRKYMRGKQGLLTDGPGIETYSQHVQVFAILTETIDQEAGKEALKKTIENKADYTQCSVAMSFYLFRALEETGLYEYTKEYWGIWRRMLKKHSTTCIEDETQERSDCHGWGALILYELPSVILGVRPESPGYKTMLIKPVAGYLKEAQGTVITPRGQIYIHWKKDKNGELHIEYTVINGNIKIKVQKEDVK